MEEKERYIFIDLEEGIELIDTENKTALDDADKIKDALNQQSKRIKELEQETYPAYKREHKRRAYLENIEVPRLDKENKQLKQQLHDLPKKIVEEIKQQLFNHFKVKNIEEYEKLSLIDSLFTADTVIEILDTILKSMEGKKMEKAICNECGRLVEIEDGEEWGYCPFCENDQVETLNYNMEEDWGGVVMEEKERYVYHEVSNEVETYECYWDNQECCELFDDKAVLNRLNEQDYELKKLNQENIKLIKENQQLKQQLAEKYKENSELEFIVEEIEQFAWEQLNNDNFDKYKAYDEMYTKIKQLTKNSPYEKQHQDKISFAIEQLEKVKNEITPIFCVPNGIYSNLHNEVFKTIYNQIKQLKELK